MRNGKRRNDKLVLGFQTQRDATGNYDLKFGRGGKKLADLGRGGGYLLKIVQDKQQLLVAEVIFEGLDDRRGAGFLQAERLGNGRCDEFKISDRIQPYEKNAVSKFIQQPDRRRP